MAFLRNPPSCSSCHPANFAPKYRLLINSTHPPSCSLSPFLFFQSFSSSSLCGCTQEFLCKKLYKGMGGRKGMGGGEMGWSSWIPRHGNVQTFTKHCGISSYQLDYWNPQRPALIWNKCWISSGPWWGLEPRGHFHRSRLLFWESGRSCWGIFPANSPLQFHSSLVPALPPLFLSFKKGLCITPFLAPLCYAVHIVTQWKAGQ